MKSKTSAAVTVLFFMAILFYIISFVDLSKGFDKMNHYHNNEYFPSKSVNAYVGGDAYNYIINAGYATGYFVLFAGFFISGTLCLTGGVVARQVGQSQTAEEGAPQAAPAEVHVQTVSENTSVELDELPDI